MHTARYSGRMKNRLTILLWLGAMILLTVQQAAAQLSPVCIHFTHGRWFNGKSFTADDFYSAHGILSRKPCNEPTDVDLNDKFAVPPYGDAHEHNFDSVARAPAQVALYLRDGVFYAQGMTDVTSGSVAVQAAGLVNTPQSVDMTYAHGGLTGFNGHPKDTYESLALGFYYASTPAQRDMVVHSSLRAGNAYWEMETSADLDREWPRILAAHPDLIKVYLTDSEHWKPHAADDPQLGRGINPALVPLVAARAHVAGLKVAAHVDTATDFHIAVAGGVDEIGHLPGYGISAKDDVARYRLSDADIRLCARRHVAVQATAALAVNERTPMEDLRVRQRSQVDNLRRLKLAGVVILIGSDSYGSDSVHEADYLRSLGLWDNLQMVRMWSVTTPQTIFPKRRIGVLQPGYECSFLLLDGNPLLAWGATHHIVDRWKQGQRVALQ